MDIVVNNIEQLPEAAKKFVENIGDARHIAFHAPMGAGKTTFIAALCEYLGVTDDISSPTFSIINEYRASADSKYPLIYHFDFYRIESEAETIDLGLDEYFDSEALCLMEWPENVEDYLPDDTLHVYIELQPDGVRKLKPKT